MSTTHPIGHTTRPGPVGPWLPAQGWIIGPAEDLLLFLGTPLLLLAAFAVAERYWSLAAVGVFSTVLAMGHYLPGLMRAYGDPILFRRFRWRFLLAPLFFITTAIVMTRAQSQVFLLVVVLWGAWHWLMQTYGLVRIYDAKVKNYDSASARLDYALCLAWFGVLYWRTDGMAGVLMHYYRAGGRLPPEAFRVLAVVWLVVTAVISLLYLLHLVRRLRAGHPPSVLKLTLLAVSFFFYLYAFGYSSSKLIAFGLFEGYHDIQYLAIVWVFNRNRAAKDPAAGAFTRFLFQRRAPLVVLYVALCLAFGSYDFVARSLNEQQLAQTALAIITGLALIHFYFDGFIWRIREPSTRSTLDVEGDEQGRRAPRLSPMTRHGLLWAALLLPLVALRTWESSGGARSDIDACRAVLQVLPKSHKAHYLLASQLTAAADHDEAMRHVQRARALRPGYDLYELLYADLMLGQEELSPEQLDELIGCYERADKTNAAEPKLHRNWARALRMRGDLPAAASHFQVALLLDPSQADTYFDYAMVLAQQQQFPAAAAACQQACQLDPGHAEAHALLASLSMALGNTTQALDHFRQALRLQPDKLQWQVQLALALATSPDPRFRNLEEALQWAEQARSAASAAPASADLLRDLSSVYAACGRRQQAADLAGQAADLYRAKGQEQLARQLMEASMHYGESQPQP